MGIDVVDIFNSRLLPNGDWYARGDDLFSDDWVVSNGVLLAQTGDSIIGGAETWGASIGGVAGNSNGDYVISGNTSDPDSAFDNVIALNGTTIVVREGDPVDLDGNGMNYIIADDQRNLETRFVHGRSLQFVGVFRTVCAEKRTDGTNARDAEQVVELTLLRARIDILRFATPLLG